jgi:hypothetical protein
MVSDLVLVSPVSDLRYSQSRVSQSSFRFPNGPTDITDMAGNAARRGGRAERELPACKSSWCGFREKKLEIVHESTVKTLTCSYMLVVPLIVTVLFFLSPAFARRNSTYSTLRKKTI